jgi:hypothetical protein
LEQEMTHPTPPAAASDFALAQAFREWKATLNDSTDIVRGGFFHAAIGLENRAAEIQSAQPSGVAVTDAMIERACKQYAFREDGAVWPDAYSEHEVAAERVLMREFLTHVLAPPIAQQGSGEVTDAMVESVARVIYEQWIGHAGYVKWAVRGNSLKQDEARALARAALASKADGEKK